jgi:hypothetical protein
MLTKAEAERFAMELEQLCRRHGVMLWVPYMATSPMMISEVGPDEAFHYTAEWTEVGRGWVINRVLGRFA